MGSVSPGKRRGAGHARSGRILATGTALSRRRREDPGASARPYTETACGTGPAPLQGCPSMSRESHASNGHPRPQGPEPDSLAALQQEALDADIAAAGRALDADPEAHALSAHVRKELDHWMDTQLDLEYEKYPNLEERDDDDSTKKTSRGPRRIYHWLAMHAWRGESRWVDSRVFPVRDESLRPPS